MRRSLISAVLSAAFVLQGCSEFTIADSYGNSYGSFYDYGNKYSWQLATCEGEVKERNIDDPARKRYMQCCMYRHGVPIMNSSGCAAS